MEVFGQVLHVVRLRCMAVFLSKGKSIRQKRPKKSEELVLAIRRKSDRYKLQSATKRQTRQAAQPRVAAQRLRFDDRGETYKNL